MAVVDGLCWYFSLDSLDIGSFGVFGSGHSVSLTEYDVPKEGLPIILVDTCPDFAHGLYGKNVSEANSYCDNTSSVDNMLKDIEQYPKILEERRTKLNSFPRSVVQSVTDKNCRNFEIDSQEYNACGTKFEISGILRQCGVDFGNLIHGTAVTSVMVSEDKSFTKISFNNDTCKITENGAVRVKGIAPGASIDHFYTKDRNTQTVEGALNSAVNKLGKTNDDVIPPVMKKRPLNIVNISRGGDLDKLSDPFKKLCDDNSNFLVFLAAGNDGRDLSEKYKKVRIEKSKIPCFILVAATNVYNDKNVSDGRVDLANFSNFSKQYVDIAAPGVNINLAAFHNKGLIGEGTSYASPLVASTALLVFECDPSASTMDRVKSTILDSADTSQIFMDKVDNGRFLNIKKSLKKSCYSAIDLITHDVQKNVTVVTNSKKSEENEKKEDL